MDLESLKRAQERLRKRLVLDDCFEKLELVGGVDVSYVEDKGFCSAVVMTLADLEPVEGKLFISTPKLPYVPNFLSFREAWFIIRTYELLKVKPDVLLVDGHGIAHPRSMGLASHVGILLDIPTIGVAKKPLVGEYSVPDDAGISEVLLDGWAVGFVLKRKKYERPIFISPGHKVSLESSFKIVEKAIRGYKLPEPLRLAHLLSKEASKREIS